MNRLLLVAVFELLAVLLLFRVAWVFVTLMRAERPDVDAAFRNMLRAFAALVFAVAGLVVVLVGGGS